MQRHLSVIVYQVHIAYSHIYTMIFIVFYSIIVDANFNCVCVFCCVSECFFYRFPSQISLYREKEFKLDIYKYKYMRDNNDNGVVVRIFIPYTQHTKKNNNNQVHFFML